MWLNISKQTLNLIIINPDKDYWYNINNLINNITINKAEYECSTLHVKPFLPHRKRLRCAELLTASCKINRKSLSELNWFCERTQKDLQGKVNIFARERNIFARERKSFAREHKVSWGNANILQGNAKFHEGKFCSPPTPIFSHHHVPETGSVHNNWSSQ